jgi:hypothetical protein
MKMLGGMRKRRSSTHLDLQALFIMTCLLFLSISTRAQRTDWRTRIDEKVQRADSLSLKSQKIFYLNKFLKDDRPVKETWYYTLLEGKIIIFEIKYVSDSIEFSEIYYLDNGRLICMEEYEVPYLSVYTDEVKKGAAMFFDNQNLRQFVVTGSNKNDYRWDRSYESLRRFEKRFEELKKTIQYEPRQ